MRRRKRQIIFEISEITENTLNNRKNNEKHLNLLNIGAFQENGDDNLTRKGTENMTNSIQKAGAGIIAAGVLLAGMSAPMIAAPSAAWAANGTVKITPVAGNNVGYKAFQIFTADIANGKAEHEAWASTAIKTAVVNAIKTIDPTYSSDSAQDALEFLDTNWGTSSSTRIVNSTEFPNTVAKNVQAVGGGTTVTAGTTNSLAEGYYLIVTDSSTLGTGESGTAPIFVAIDDASPVDINEKTSIPTVTKEVKDDASGSDWSDHADANTGQSLEYKLTGHLPSNIGTYATYEYEFEDTLTHLALSADEQENIRVTVGSTDVTSMIAGTAGIGCTTVDDENHQTGSNITYANNKLKVTIKDLKALGVTLDASTTVVVTYSAHLDGSAVTGSTGNPNTVTLTYSNNPNQTGTGTTNEVTVKTYTYKLKLTKVDKDNNTTLLPGAKFKMQLTNAAAGAPTYEEASVTVGATIESDTLYESDGNGGYVATQDATVLSGKTYYTQTPGSPAGNDSLAGSWVKQDGSLTSSAAEAFEFTTDANGVFEVSGLDAGTYTIIETAAPEDYDVWDTPITVTISPTFEGTPSALNNLTASLTGGETGSEVTEVNKTTGVVSVKATDDKEVDLPLTGQLGIAGSIALGVLLVGAGVVMTVRRSRQNEEE